MDSRSVVEEAMERAGLTQTELARLSGIRQPSISQFLSGRIRMSDAQVDRVLACTGYRLEVVHRAVAPDLTRSEWRSWRLHRELSGRLDREALDRWRPTIEQNVVRLRRAVQGRPHEENVERWAEMLSRADLLALHRVLTGLDRDAIEMREVSPMSGLLSDDDRAALLDAAT